MSADELADYFSRLEVEMVLARARTRARAAASSAPAYTSRPSTPTVGSTAYTVYVGLEPGVYTTLPACLRQVEAVPHNSYKSFSSFSAAQRAFSAAAERGLVSTAAERAADIRRVVERQCMDLADLPLCLAFVDDPTSKAMVEGSHRFYVVYSGLQPGVYLTYHECTYLTSGYKGARHRSFVTEEEAVESMKEELRSGRVYKFVLQ
ncbi:hypothetical protein GGF50DRAFT_120745 [Schizophyllum commune]